MAKKRRPGPGRDGGREATKEPRLWLHLSLIIIGFVMLMISLWLLGGSTQVRTPVAAPPKTASPAPAIPSEDHLDDVSRYHANLRRMRRHLRTKDPRALALACAGFKVLSNMGRQSPKTVRHASAYFSARCLELSGDTGPRETLIRQGLFSRSHYDFFFSSRDTATVITYLLAGACEDNRSTLARALDRHAKAHQGRYPHSLAALVPGTISDHPACPATDTRTYKLDQRTLQPGRLPVITCSHHALTQRDRRQGPRPAPDHGKPPLRYSKQQFKIYTMLIEGYADQSRFHAFWPVLLKASSLRAGQVVADIGCGPGMFTFALARQVGPGGKVHAVDINQSVLDYVKFAARRGGVANVETVLTRQDLVGLPARSVDVAFLIETYHANLDIDAPREEANYTRRLAPWLRNILETLKPGGRLVVEDCKVGRDVVRDHLVKAGFQVQPGISLEAKNESCVSVFRRPL